MEIVIVVVLECVDVSDVFFLCLGKIIVDFFFGSVVGIGSLCWWVFLLNLRFDFMIWSLCGNVLMCVEKFDSGEYDVIVFVKVGLMWLGLESKIFFVLLIDIFLFVVL